MQNSDTTRVDEPEILSKFQFLNHTKYSLQLRDSFENKWFNLLMKSECTCYLEKILCNYQLFIYVKSE